MTISFHGVSAKLARAKDHLFRLDREINDFLKATPVLVVEEKQERCTILRARLPQGVPEEMQVLAGEVLSNLRSALDHMVFAVVLEVSPDTEEHDLSFPIAREDDADYVRKRAMLFPEKLAEIIQAARPYRSGNPTLWALAKLNNVDKHRRLIAVGGVRRGFVIEDAIVYGSADIRQTFAEDLSVGCEILRMENIVFPAPYTFADKVTVDVSIAFSDYLEVAKEPAVNILKRMTAIVEHIVRSVDEAYKP